MEAVSWNLLNDVLQMVITALVPVLLGYAVVWLKKQRDLLALKFDQQQWGLVEEFTRLMVMAAEQSGIAGYIGEVGEEKKALVLAQVEAFLETNEIDVDIDVIADLIEALVMQEFNWHNARKK